MNLLSRLQANAESNALPFHHIRFGDCWSAEDWPQLAALVETIPDSYITRFNPGYEDSYENEDIYCLNTYRRQESNLLSSFLEQLASEPVVSWLLNQFGLQQIRQFKVDCNLHRERAGFAGLSPHTDMFQSQNRKVLNLFFYLSSQENCPEKYGTYLIPGTEDRYDENQRQLIPYQANTGLAFAITDKSWHSVDLIEQDCRRRDVLVMRVIA